jgi:hypothetical protein
VFSACNDDNGINVATLEALNTRLTLDDLMDILEMKAVRDSWSHAEMFNADERAAHDRAVREAGG